MAPSQNSNGPNNTTIFIDIAIGIAIILVGAIIYIGRLLYKRRRRRKDLESDLGPIIEMEEMDTETPPKKTAADHLDELKEATQKVLQPLRRNSSTILTPKLSLEKSSNSSDGMKYSNRTITSIPYRKVPPPPPPSPLKIDDIKVDPIRMSMLNLLLSGTSKTIENSVNSVNSSKISSTQSRRISRRASHRTSRVKSRVISRASLQSPSKKDLTPPQTTSQLDLVLPSEIRLKRSLIHHPRTTSQLNLIHPSETRLIPPPQITSQLDLKLPSETSSKRDLTPSPPLIPSSKIRSKRSNRKLRSHYSFNKETNDYTNFQPIQNIKPIKSDQTAQLEKMTPAEITETGELTLSPMYKTVSKENQDDEVILDATLE